MMFKLSFLICVNFLLLNVLEALPARSNNFIEKDESCKAVCAICGCEGFFCLNQADESDQECICECNLESDDKLECIVDMKKECVKNGLEYELILQGSNRRALRQAGEYLPVDGELRKQFRSWQKRDSPTSTTTTTKKPQNDSIFNQIVAAPVQPGYGGGFGGENSKFGAVLTEWFKNLDGATLSFALPENFDLGSLNEEVLGTSLLPLSLIPPVPSLTPLPLPSLPSLGPSLPSLPIPSAPIGPLPSLNSLRPLFSTPPPPRSRAAFPFGSIWPLVGAPNPEQEKDNVSQTEAPKP